MTVNVLFDIGYDFGAPDTTQYFHIGNATYGKIGTGKIGPEHLLTDVLNDRLLSFSTSRSSSRVVGPIVTYEAGTASATLINDDGLLDPAVMSESAVMAALRIRAEYNGVVYPVFRGFVTRWVPEHRYPTHAVVNITAVDGFHILSQYLRTALGSPIGAGEDTGARINRILNSVNWSLADRSIAVGDSTLQATTLEGDALAEAQEAMVAEAGEFYCDESGLMFFRNRLAQLTDTRSTTSQGIFGSDIGGGELPYVDVPGLSDDDDQLVNLISATRVGGAEQVVEDATSRARYLDHKHEQSNMLLQDDAEVRNWAGYVLHADHLPEFRFTSLNIDPRINEAQLFPQVLGRRFGDRITVVRRPPASPWGTVTDSRDVYIRGISHAWSRPNKWATTWALQPVDKTSYFIIGHPVNGRIGRNALAY